MRSRIKFKKFLFNNQAVAAIEVAILLPLLVALFVGVVEVTRLIIINQKVEKVASSLADFTARNVNGCIEVGELNSFMEAAIRIMDPYDFGGQTSNLYISSISASDMPTAPCDMFPGEACMLWQYQPDGNSGANTSNVGAAGSNNIALPGEAPLTNNQSLITVEVFYQASPVLDFMDNFISISESFDIYRTAAQRPRQVGALTNIATDCSDGSSGIVSGAGFGVVPPPDSGDDEGDSPYQDPGSDGSDGDEIDEPGDVDDPPSGPSFGGRPGSEPDDPPSGPGGDPSGDPSEEDEEDTPSGTTTGFDGRPGTNDDPGGPSDGGGDDGGPPGFAEGR